MNKSSRLNDGTLGYGSSRNQEVIAAKYLKAKKIGRGVKKAEATIIDINNKIMKTIDAKSNSGHSKENSFPHPKTRGRTQVRKSNRNMTGEGRYKSMKDRVKSSKQKYARCLTKIGHNQFKSCFESDSTPEKDCKPPKLSVIEST